MHFTFLLAALRARIRLFASIVTITVLAALAVSLIVSKTYIARVSILVDGKFEQSLSSSHLWQDRERAGYLQTQVDIITSPKVAGRVIGDLKLDENAELRQEFEESGSAATFKEWMTERLLKLLKIDTSESSIIYLAFSAKDPVFAAQVANAFAKAYIDTVLEMRVKPLQQTSEWFDEQLKGLRENMDQAHRRLTEFQQRNRIVSADENYDFENIQLADLANQVTSIRSYGNGGRTRGDHGAAPGRLSSSHTSPAIENLKAALIRSEARLQELSAELGSRHPQYLRQSAELASLRDRMNAEVSALAANAEAAARREQQRKQQLLGAMEAQRDRVLSHKEARNQLGALHNDVAIAQRTYDAAMQRFMASKIESRASLANVSVFNEALPPTRPARPRLTLNLILALAIGMLLGLAAVHLIEASDHRVRLIDDLDGDPNTPLLGVLNAHDSVATRLLGKPAAPLQVLPGPG